MAITIFVIVSLFYGCEFLLFALQCLKPDPVPLGDEDQWRGTPDDWPELWRRKPEELMCINWKEDGF